MKEEEERGEKDTRENCKGLGKMREEKYSERTREISQCSNELKEKRRENKDGGKERRKNK